MSNQNSQNFSVILAVVFIAAIAFGGVYMWQIESQEEVSTLENVKVNSAAALLNCKNDWIEYTSKNISFCYDASWGEPKVDDRSSSQGVAYDQFYLGFYKGRSVNTHAPELWWILDTFSPMFGGGGTWFGGYGEIDFSQTEEEIMAIFNRYIDGLEKGNNTLEKVEVGGKKAIRLHKNYTKNYTMVGWDEDQVNTVDYYIPYAFGKYHVSIGIDYEDVETLDAFVENILFEG